MREVGDKVWIVDPVYMRAFEGIITGSYEEPGPYIIKGYLVKTNISDHSEIHDIDRIYNTESEAKSGYKDFLERKLQRTKNDVERIKSLLDREV